MMSREGSDLSMMMYQTPEAKVIIDGITRTEGFIIGTFINKVNFSSSCVWVLSR